MINRNQQLVVVGAGPAGLAAALAARQAGMDVTIIDESGKLGGQYFRGRQASQVEGSPNHFTQHAHGIETILNAAVVDAPAPGALSVWSEGQGVRSLTYDRLVIATGAYDRTVALPGWTLPGVFTAGAASILAKAHGLTPGKRMLVAGSGPFLLAVADDVSRKGCQVEVIEATPFSESLSGLKTIARDFEIARQTLGYLTRLTARGVRRSYGQMVTQIHGRDRVETATIHKVDANWNPIAGSERVVEVDSVCLGFGFVPQLELAQALGCALAYDETASNFFVEVDLAMRTSQAGIYAAGEVAGIGGMRVAMAQGQLAGLTAACDSKLLSAETYTAQARAIIKRLNFIQRIAGWMRTAYRPRPGLWALADDATMLCRCEDISIATAKTALENNPPTPYAVKTATRAGMGLCQGRICSPYLIEWLRAQHGYTVPAEGRPWRLRPPIRPVPLSDWLAPEAVQ